MKVEDLILQLQDVISAAKSMPFSGGKVMVSSDEIYDILDRFRTLCLSRGKTGKEYCC